MFISGLLQIGPGEGIFAFNPALLSITIPSTVTVIGGCLYHYNIIISFLGAYVFYYCQSVTKLTLGIRLKVIGTMCFAALQLSSLTVPSSVTYFGIKILM